MAVTDVLLLGGGGHASDLLGIIEAANEREHRWNVLGVFDDNAHTERFAGRRIKIFPNIESIAGQFDTQKVRFISAVGNPVLRLKIARSAESLGYQAAPALIHPGCVYYGTGVTVGDGSIVHAGVSLSVKATIKSHCYISHGALVGHDSLIHDGAIMQPGANTAGGVELGEGAMIGMGAMIVENVRIGRFSTVGAGAVVTKDVDDNTTVVGIPAKPIAA